MISLTLAHQAPLSMGFPREEYWSRRPFTSSGDLPDPGIKPRSLHCMWILYHRDVRDAGLVSWVGKIPLRRAWQPTPVFLPGKSHGHRSLAGYSLRYCTETDITEATGRTHRRLHTLHEAAFKSKYVTPKTTENLEGASIVSLVPDWKGTLK